VVIPWWFLVLVEWEGSRVNASLTLVLLNVKGKWALVGVGLGVECWIRVLGRLDGFVFGFDYANGNELNYNYE
jgi:hypothetical protein